MYRPDNQDPGPAILFRFRFPLLRPDSFEEQWVRRVEDALAEAFGDYSPVLEHWANIDPDDQICIVNENGNHFTLAKQERTP